MICVKCYDGGKIIPVKNRCPICGNGKFFIRKEKLMANRAEPEVMDVPRQDQIVSTRIVEMIAERLRLTYSPPKSGEAITTIEEFCLVVEKALAKGYHPLAPGFHYWKQGGKIYVEDHYATWVRWAQPIDPFPVNPVTIEDESGWTCTVTIIKRSDRDKYQEAKTTLLKVLLDAGVDYKEAIGVADEEARQSYATARTGFVPRREVYGKDSNGKEYPKTGATPKGWTPGVTRAEVRAIKNAIRAAFGVPTPADIRALIFRDLDISQERALELAATMPEGIASESGNIRERFLRLQASHDKNKEEIDKMSPEELHRSAQEGSRIIRGPEEKDGEGIGDDWKDVIEQDALVVLRDAIDEQELSDLREEAEGALDAAGIAEGNWQSLFQAIFGIDDLTHLDEIELKNLMQYLTRFSILKSGKLKDAVEKIPEIEGAKSKAIAGKMLKDAARDASRDDLLLPTLKKQEEKENA